MTTRTTGPGYRALLSIPGAAAASAAALVGRMPISMLGVGSVLLVVDRRGSYALAGAVSAAYALGLAALGPAVSRLVDARGQGRVLPVALAVHAVALVGVLLLASRGPAGLLLLAAGLAGGALPPLGACVRARWAVLLGERGRGDELPTALALEAVADEVVFVVGPLLVVLAATADPALGLWLAVVLVVAGTLAFAAQPGARTAGAEPGRGSAMRLAGVRVLVLSMVMVGAVFGAAEVAMVAFADDRGAPGRTGLLLALIAAGSAVAGLGYGARAWRAPLDRRYLLALAGLCVGTVPLLLVPGVGTMAAAALLAGVAISPTLIASFGLVESLVSAGARTEGFAWLNSGLGVGVAAGSALAGVLADTSGGRAGFAVCVAGAALALLVAAAGRDALHPRSS